VTVAVCERQRCRALLEPTPMLRLEGGRACGTKRPWPARLAQGEPQARAAFGWAIVDGQPSLWPSRVSSDRPPPAVQPSGAQPLFAARLAGLRPNLEAGARRTCTCFGGFVRSWPCRDLARGKRCVRTRLPHARAILPQRPWPCGAPA